MSMSRSSSRIRRARPLPIGDVMLVEAQVHHRGGVGQHRVDTPVGAVSHQARPCQRLDGSSGEQDLTAERLVESGEESPREETGQGGP